MLKPVLNCIHLNAESVPFLFFHLDLALHVRKVFKNESVLFVSHIALKSIFGLQFTWVSD